MNSILKRRIFINYKPSSRPAFLFNILYIENNTLTRRDTSILLQPLCSKLIVVKSIIEALNKLKNNHIDLIITDLYMPNVNGTEIIEKIKEDNSDIPIVIISAHLDREVLYKSINCGIQGYLIKPIESSQLLKKVEEIKEVLKKNILIQQYQTITDESSIISKTNKEGIITYVNDTFCAISGYTREELIGESHNILRSKEESIQLFENLWRRISQKKKVWTGVIKNQNKSGKTFYIKTTIKPILNTHGEIEEFIALAMPITNIIHPQKQLNDFLTPLTHAIVVLIKIEEFKYLNHSLTNKISKRLQRVFAEELFKNMPRKCNFSKVYLLDHGKFVFVKKDHFPQEINILEEEIKKFQKRVNQKKIKIGLIDYDLTIATSLAYGENALENAHAGLRQLLKTKKTFIVANTLIEEEKDQAIKKLKTFKMLKKAIESYNIVSYFQPIINNKTKAIEKYESLVRLIDENENILTPYLFLDTAKEGKYYQEITSIVLKNSFQALYTTDMNISINLSALDIEQRETREEFLFLLQKHKEQTHRIVIELLEDENIHDRKIIKNFMKAIREFGVKVAIDDFGTGLSNFSRVLHYQPDFIKIDGSLIKNIEHDEFSKNMVETIVMFSKKQNIKTIAEYVENENIFNILCEMGVDYSQGYYFGKAEVL